ncbi:hypothetical protein DSM112329_05460 [Paraconexibacter sp. AEG42_29]|uniref:Uncharacterized protein n=1 Tax=Paraconexibacter sp. AEG42_29 TaxID=2997339 RepID=A0AAU7B3W5_9ACTN
MATQIHPSDLDAWHGRARRDPGVGFLEQAGVVLVILEPGQVCIAPFARNIERTAKVLADAHAMLRIAHDSEFLVVHITPKLLRERRRSGWAAQGISIDVDLEPLPGLDYGALLLDALPGDRDGAGSPWACGAHRELIAESRARQRPGAAIRARRRQR